MAPQRTRQRPTHRWSGLGLAAVALSAAACSAGPAQPTLKELATSPLLEPVEGEALLGTYRLQPRRQQVGNPGRDGTIERVAAFTRDLDDLADEQQARVPGLSRVDVGEPIPASIELRGRTADGGRAIVVIRTGDPRPQFVSLDALLPMPATATTSMVVTLVSDQ